MLIIKGNDGGLPIYGLSLC